MYIYIYSVNIEIYIYVLMEVPPKDPPPVSGTLVEIRIFVEWNSFSIPHHFWVHVSFWECNCISIPTTPNQKKSLFKDLEEFSAVGGESVSRISCLRVNVKIPGWCNMKLQFQASRGLVSPKRKLHCPRIHG